MIDCGKLLCVVLRAISHLILDFLHLLRIEISWRRVDRGRGAIRQGPRLVEHGPHLLNLRYLHRQLVEGIVNQI